MIAQCEKTAYTFRDWYLHIRCPGSPENSNRVLYLAYVIWEEDFPHVIDQGDLENLLIATLTYCFAHFDPSKGCQDISEQERFLRFFKHWFRRRLRDAARDHRRPHRAKATARYLQWTATLRPSSRKEDDYMDWSWFLYGQALRRLSREAQKFVRLHIVQDKTLDEIVPLMGVSKSTLCRKYKFDRLVQIIKEEVKEMVMSIPRINLEALVYTLYIESGFSEDEIARLFCVPESFVTGIIRGLTVRVMQRLEGETGRMLFSDGSPAMT